MLTNDQVQALLAISVPPSNSRAGWSFNVLAINEARKQLSIALPIKLRFMSAQYRHGTHYAREGYHAITIDQDRPIDQANETLWHELAHAYQCELFTKITGKSQTDFFGLAYAPNGRTGNRYLNNPFEVDARRIGKENKHTWLLAID